MVASFGGLALVVLAAVASVAYVLQRRSLEANALERLATVAAVKEGELNRWVSDQREELQVLASLATTRTVAEALAGDPTDVQAATVLQDLVDRAAGTGADVQEMFVMSPSGGRVLASSDPSRVGAFHLEDRFFQEGKRETFVQNVYSSPLTARPTLTIATPVLGESGLVAVLAVHLNLARLDRILSETATVGRTAKAMAVTRSYDPISSERFGIADERLLRGIHTEGVTRVVAGGEGRGAYRNVDGRPVLGAYRWIEAREVGLVLEMDQAEALELARYNLVGILAVGVTATLILLLGVGRIGHSVGGALAQLTSGAAKVAEGAFEVEVDTHREDEVGDLGRAFNAMTVQLRKLYGDLQGQVEVNETMLLALEEGRALLEAIVQNSSAFIAVYHPDSGIVLANRALEEALGVGPDGLLGGCIADHLDEDQARSYLDARYRALEENRTVKGEIHMDIAGEDHTFFAVWFPLRDGQGLPFSVGLIASDISERIRAENERVRYEAQLRHAQKLESLGVLAGGIAHDFNNILAAILGHADLAMATAERDPEGAYHLQQVILASQRAATLTNQMLAYAGRASLQVEVLDLNEAVQEVWSLLSVSMGKKIRLEQDLSPHPCSVRADPAQISQVVMNLVTNAAQAIGDVPGTVTVRTTTEVVAGATGDGVRPGRYARLTVRDTGCGMDDDTLERIFDPFFTTKESGRGLGLAAVMGIVSGLGGGIRVDSAEGRGTSFEILLPEASATRAPRAGSVARARQGPGVTVLLADDEEAVRGMARRVLERAGHTVIEAKDGLDAVRRYDEDALRVSAAVLDVSMPGLGGREVFDELRKRSPSLPVVFTTGYDPVDAIRGLDAAPSVGFLQKPYRPADLVQALSALLSASTP